MYCNVRGAVLCERKMGMHVSISVSLSQPAMNNRAIASTVDGIEGGTERL